MRLQVRTQGRAAAGGDGDPRPAHAPEATQGLALTADRHPRPAVGNVRGGASLEPQGSSFGAGPLRRVL